MLGQDATNSGSHIVMAQGSVLVVRCIYSCHT